MQACRNFWGLYMGSHAHIETIHYNKTWQKILPGLHVHVLNKVILQSESESEAAYKISDVIRLLAPWGGQNLTQPPAADTPCFTVRIAPTVFVCSRFLLRVLIKFTEENTRSTSALAWGKHSKDCMNLLRVLNWRAPVPSDNLSSLPQNTSGSMSSLSNGKETRDSLRHSLSSNWIFASGSILGNLAARGTNEGNYSQLDPTLVASQ